ncbi:MAG: DUF1684 domain-containing protein [Bacteroidetes bacterium]|nr:DUF1684 domain-containing protein [Bacteroidota bacterium]
MKTGWFKTGIILWLLFVMGAKVSEAQTSGEQSSGGRMSGEQVSGGRMSGGRMSGEQRSGTQTGYIDSLLGWRRNYIETHEILKTPEERRLLRFYGVNPDYRVDCSFERVADSGWFEMQTSGKPKTARKYGRLTFKLHDTTLHLVVFQLQMLLARADTREFLFVGFTDVTSAVDTYGAGRYIDCMIGDIHGNKMVLDFNKAYNPNCAYTSGYNCPIPPRENDLPVAILAGERNYGGKIH